MKTRKEIIKSKQLIGIFSMLFTYAYGQVQISSEKKLFSEKVEYETSSFFLNGVKFNGSISSVQWKNSESLTEAYSYDYDNRNQLLQAEYYAKTGNQNYLNTPDFDVKGLQYDLNGNIESLKRYNPMGLMDDLQYTYDLNNQLDKVEETADLNQGYVSTQTINGYSYDDAGNVTRDNGKRVFIHYNHLNLPVIFAFDNLDTIKVIYDANGRKVQKITKKNDGSPIEYKYYAAGCEYSNDQLEAIYNEEGRAIESNNGFQYEYTLKDHLGNSRVMFSDLNNDEKIDDNEVLQKNDYYPFGMNMQKNYSQIGTENSYQYNSKEMISDLGLNMLDYGARWYDPSIARWHTIDPLAEEFTNWSPYNYVLNNPIRLIDPNGMAPDDPPNGTWYSALEDGILTYYYDANIHSREEFNELGLAEHGFQYENGVHIYNSYDTQITMKFNGDGSYEITSSTDVPEFAQYLEDKYQTGTDIISGKMTLADDFFQNGNTANIGKEVQYDLYSYEYLGDGKSSWGATERGTTISIKDYTSARELYDNSGYGLQGSHGSLCKTCQITHKASLQGIKANPGLIQLMQPLTNGHRSHIKTNPHTDQ
ncbi:MAG: RHS repeat-associated core domain-containing protein [Flavobacteriales bacterium]|nr:RHS repeat-associated core domain-containing protein [Flavobacteriales bacterium]